MTTEEHREHAELIHKFGCSDITPAQLERLAELDSLAGRAAGAGVCPWLPSARQPAALTNKLMDRLLEPSKLEPAVEGGSMQRMGRLRATTARERALEKKVETLKDYIRKEGVINDTCTYDVLREICEGCRCKRQPQPTESSSAAALGGKGAS